MGRTSSHEGSEWKKGRRERHRDLELEEGKERDDHKELKPSRNLSKTTASIVTALTLFSLLLFIALSVYQQPVQESSSSTVSASTLDQGVQGHRRLLQAPSANTSTIGLVCAATLYPDSCLTALNSDPRAQTGNAQDLVQTSTIIAKEHSLAAVYDSQMLASLVGQAANVNLTAVSAQCNEGLDLASYHLQNSENAFSSLAWKDIQAWVSGALTFGTDCYSSLKPFQPTLAFVPGMLDRLNTTLELISNALAMTDALINYGPDAIVWQPPPENRMSQLNQLLSSYCDYFPAWLGHREQTMMNMAPDELDFTPAVTVSLDSALPSIQLAVNQAPSWNSARFVIYIKAGVYSEIVRVPKEKTNLMFVGDGINMTIITGNMNAQQTGLTTWLTPTVAINGAGFLARGITFENTAGPERHQAVALRVDSDQSAFQSCSIVGYQDSLYTHAFRQFYKDCTVEGTIDYIFGNSASLFQNCNIVVRVGRAEAITSTLTAQGRTDPGMSTGSVFQNCSVYGTPEYEALFQSNQTGHRAYLGRPWKTFSRTIFIYTYLSAIMNPVGWLPWNGTFALDTLLDAEYGSYGPGAVDLSQRVVWSSQLSLTQAQIFSAQRFLQADMWLPQTQIPYSPAI